MNIRTADKNDIAAIRQLYFELDQDAVMYQPEHFVLFPRPEEFLAKIIEDEKSDILVCDEDGSVIGFTLRISKEHGRYTFL
jgi:N-acetylglutamate synthase-like GNAT family acetyltransferase